MAGRRVPRAARIRQFGLWRGGAQAQPWRGGTGRAGRGIVARVSWPQAPAAARARRVSAVARTVSDCAAADTTGPWPSRVQTSRLALASGNWLVHRWYSLLVDEGTTGDDSTAAAAAALGRGRCSSSSPGMPELVLAGPGGVPRAVRRNDRWRRRVGWAEEQTVQGLKLAEIHSARSQHRYRRRGPRSVQLNASTVGGGPQRCTEELVVGPPPACRPAIADGAARSLRGRGEVVVPSAGRGFQVVGVPRCSPGSHQPARDDQSRVGPRALAASSEVPPRVRRWRVAHHAPRAVPPEVGGEMVAQGTPGGVRCRGWGRRPRLPGSAAGSRAGEFKARWMSWR